MDDTKLKKLRFQLDSILTKIKMKENTVKLRKSYELELDAKRRELEDYLETLDFDNTEEVTFYPELLDDNFNTKILKKKEFFDYRSIKNDRVTIEDACDIKTGDFTLSNPQTFIRNFISPSTPYNGVLMWWGVGVGKTCGAISIAEQYKSKVSDRFSLKKTLVITSGDTITTSWRKQIFDPLKEFEDEETENRQCTGDSYSTEWRRLVREKAEKQKKPLDNEQKEKIAKKLIKENYEFYGYIAFAGFLQELESRALKIKSKKLGDEEAKILMIREVFSNRVIIIDEAHNTNPNSELMGKKSKDQKSLKVFPDCIKRVLRYSENTKLILLTATPINNQPKEILWLINLLLLNDNRGTIREDEIFNLDGSFAPDGKELLLKKSRGYISYMRSEDPVTYPERTNMLLAENENFRVYYPGIHGGLKMEKARSKDNYKYLPLIDNPMSIPQYVNYLQTINQNKSDKFTTFKKGLMGNNAKAKQNLIMMFPKKYKGGIHEFELSNSSEECFKILKNKPRKIYSWCKGFLKQENIGRYSSKFLTTLKCVKKLDGIALVHIQFKELARTFAMMLEDNGYDSLYKEDALLDTDTEKINRKYVLITGETNKKKLGKIIDFNNSSKNIRGKQLQVIIVTDVAKEGLSFFNIREIHIMSPWWHINRLEQIIGRGMRKCSHKLLPKEDRNVAIYYHTSTVPEFTKKDYGKTKDRRVYNIVDTQVNDIVTALKAVIPIHSEKFNNKWVVNNILRKETLDEYIYWLSVEKAITIAPVEALLKSNAVDCNLTK